MRGARAHGWSLRRFLRQSSDVTTKTVFWEDSAATLGLVIAALGLAIAELSQNETVDGVASVMIGVVLTAIALMVGTQARQLLLGAAVYPELREQIRQTAPAFGEVENVVRLLTMQMGTRSVLVTGELQLSRDPDIRQAEYLIEQIDASLRRT